MNHNRVDEKLFRLIVFLVFNFRLVTCLDTGVWTSSINFRFDDARVAFCFLLISVLVAYLSVILIIVGNDIFHVGISFASFADHFIGWNIFRSSFFLCSLGARATPIEKNVRRTGPSSRLQLCFIDVGYLEGELYDRHKFLSLILRVISFDPDVDVVIHVDDFRLLTKWCVVFLLIISLRLVE